MKVPVYLTPLSLVLWGALSGNIEAAVILLGLMGIHSVSQWRMRLSDRQFYRIGDFISLVILTVLAYTYLSGLTDRPIFVILEWLPLFYAPALIAQLFSTRTYLPLGTIFYSMRGLKTGSSAAEIDFRLPYSGICLIAAGAAKIATPLYFVATAAVVLMVLWQVRNKRQPALIWLFVTGVAFSFSYIGYQQLSRAHERLEQQIISWLSEMMLDPYKSSTSIGDIGRLKLSNQIMMRIKNEHSLLLHQASYDRYVNQSWYASIRGFRPFKNYKSNEHEQKLTIIQNLSYKTILALPPGTRRINGLATQNLTVNPFAVVRSEGIEGLTEFDVHFSGKFQSNVSHYDRQIPKFHLSWLRQIIPPLVSAVSQQQTINNIKRYFNQGYYYTLNNDKEQEPDRALEDFVLKNKAGHCEYYAVATVLMLRYAGIPARLANGFAVQEFDTDENLFIVRKRHAHAWALAFINGSWQAVDTTPATWLQLESQNITAWQQLSDWFSKQIFKFNRWRSEQSEKTLLEYQYFILALLTGILAFRFYKNRKLIIKTAKTAPNLNSPGLFPGYDSEFFLIEQKLKTTDIAKKTNESYQDWIMRIDKPELLSLLDLHQRYRFDPNGISMEERNQLKQIVSIWLEKNIG